MKLTKKEVDEATCPPGRKDKLFVADDRTGFTLRVTEQGSKVFLFRYRAGRRMRTLRLGQYGDITPAQARVLAQQARLQVAAGKDPVGERQALARQEALTFTTLAERWCEQGLQGRKERYTSEAARALRVNFSRLANTAAASVTQSEAQDNLDRIAADRGAAMVRRSQAYARAMYGWAVKRGLLSDNPFARSSVDGREVSRDRVLSDIELGDVWRATAVLGWPFGPYFRFLILTLQRETETAGLRWDELDADRRVWTIPSKRTKNGKPHMVHLSDPARAVLDAIPRGPADTLAFSTTGNTAISGFSKGKARLDKAIEAARATEAAKLGTKPAPLEPWRLHDLRQTGVTTLARLRVPWEVADKMLNHVQGAIKGVAATYQRHDYWEERRQAMDVWAAHVISVGETSAPSATDRRNIDSGHGVESHDEQVTEG